MSKVLPLVAGGIVAGAGLAAGLPHFSAGMRKSFRTRLEEQQAKKEMGPLGLGQDLGPGRFKFANSEDSKMPTSTLDDVYVARAHGHLSDDEVTELETFSDVLTKSASFGDSFRHGLGAAAATAVGGLAMVGISHGIKTSYDAMTFEKDLQATLKVRPELSTYPKEQVRLVYQSLRRLSPEIAKDPLTASTYLLRQFERRNPSDPHSLPTVELETARSLTQITGELGKRRDTVRDTLLDANRLGVQAGMEHLRDARANERAEKRRLEDAKARLAQQAHAERMEDLRGQTQASASMFRQGELEQRLREEQNRAAAAEARVESLNQQIVSNSPASRQQRVADQARQMREARNAGLPNPFGKPKRR